MDHMTALRVFREVVEQGSFAGAARKMNLSPAAVSKNIGELEAHLGTRLLHRTTRRMSNTEAGELYYKEVARVLDDLNEAEALLGPMQQSPRGHLRVTAPMSLALMRLTPRMPEFFEAYPQLSVDLHLDSRRVNIVEEGFDLAIRVSDGLVDSSLIAKKIMTVDSVVIASPDYLERYGEPSAPADLLNHNCIKFSLSGHVDEWAFRIEDESQTIPIDGRYRATSSFAVIDAVLGGFGISLLPRIYIEEHIKAGRLKVLLGDWQTNRTTVYAVYPSRRHLPPKVRAFLDFAVEVLREEPDRPAVSRS